MPRVLSAARLFHTMVRVVVLASLLSGAAGLGTGCSSPACRWPPSPPLPLDHPLLAKQPGALAEQVHLIGGPPDKVGIVWVGPLNASWGSQIVEYCIKSTNPDAICARNRTMSVVARGPWTYSSNQWDKKTRCPHYVEGFRCLYQSPALYAAVLRHLSPGSVYRYRLGAERAWRHLRTPPAVGRPIDFGVVGDLGQTSDSKATMEAMLEQAQDHSIDSILFAGDLAYADGLGERWDSYARLVEPLFSQTVASYVGGNHEFDKGKENWHPFLERYPPLFLHRDSGSTQKLFYSFEAGLAHVLMLCSYCLSQDGTPQYLWLEQDLARVDRARTPWLVAMWHTPWYTSNAHHRMAEGQDMRQALEDMLHSAGVDIVFTGHVHAYERTRPVFRNATAEDCGAVHVTIGDGGNREGFAYNWSTPETPGPPLYGQPEWSAYREFAFGHGRLRLRSADLGVWEWFRNDDAGRVVSDSTQLRPNRGCPAGVVV